MPDEDSESHPARAGRRQLLQAGLAGAALLRLAAPARAEPAFDVQLLQTAVSIENLAVTAYDTMLGLPLLTAATVNPTVKSLFATAREHHAAHAVAVNQAIGDLGGKPQSGINPALADVLDQQRPGLVDLITVTDLALRIETVAAHTYQNTVGLIGDVHARNLAGAVLGTEAQHVALLRLASAIVAARVTDLLNLDPGTAGALPPTLGGAGFPEPFARSDQARPPREGALE